MYFQPRVIYRDPNEERKDSVIRYIGNRVLRNNKNFLCALTGQTGAGKSWSGLSLCESYAKMHNVPFNPHDHVLFSLKQLLQLITGKDMHKKIQYGSVLMFDEPQIEANARDWRSEANTILNQLVSTFRNQRLVVFFATPFLEFIDKQSRILFHGEFKVLGYDKNTQITTLKPRFLEYNKDMGNFYQKRLIVEYAVHDKQVHDQIKLNKWHINKPSQNTIDVYESKKQKFTDELNKKLLKSIEIKEQQEMGKNKAEDLLRIRDLYTRYGEDYLKIAQEMPHISPLTIEKMILLIKRTLKKKPALNAST